ncbi:hypothetical protein M409DRAFT_18780 [Zasmidium cellare ATCC 36951]|uniref:Cytochrome P450 n=1 Tax=Zasmidium cellare ATCC 36951 TaxID=1080233 RepID=A0A6A6CZK6_ZASCE|nr:uncharacterized protein M409DRAFT_18780 [Zasmidium cellare ATCC 36951]KAF2170806.1 hypothetical protein M409DRAFT_18780 [Zasmidium cellare ATCC 36951]
MLAGKELDAMSEREKEGKYEEVCRITNVAAFTNEHQYLKEGYERYSKHGKPFVLPGLHWPEVVLPPEDVKWLASLPEDVCDATHVQEELLGLRYISHGPDIEWVHDFSNIRRDLKIHMTDALPEVLDEVKIAFSSALGQPHTWTRIKALKAMKTATMGVFNRITVGQLLCRDDKYLSAVQRMVMTFALTGIVYRFLIPNCLKKWVMPAVSKPYRWALTRASAMYMPTVQKRLHEYKVSKSRDGLPNDMLQWTIERAVSKYGSSAVGVQDVADTMVFLNIFAAITIDLVLDTVLIDVLSYSPNSMLVQQLRREADEALPRLNQNPLGALAEMTKIDSVIRETLRIHPPNDHGMMRQIVKPGGVTTPGGLYLPEGTHVGAHVAAVQRDTKTCHDADQYRPLRFSEDRQQVGEPSTTAVHISDKFLPFALGRHACPGRFFAVHVLKLILGHIFTAYDFEPLSERPVVRSIGGINLPDDNTLIGVRLRQRHAGSKN